MAISENAVSDACLQMLAASTDIQREYRQFLTGTGRFWIGKYAGDIWTTGAIATLVSVCFAELHV